MTSATSTHPFRRLWHHASAHRPKLVLAAVLSTLNKACDVVPELLIGVAIDVVVRAEESFLSTAFGIEDRFDQLVALAVLNVVAWVLESITDYAAHVGWRNLAHPEWVRSASVSWPRRVATSR